MQKPILLVGTGRIAREHARVLKALRVPAVVVGRSKAGTAAFEKETGLEARGGGLRALKGPLPSRAIIAVDADKLCAVAGEAIRRGTRELLVEKPGGLALRELQKLHKIARTHKARVWIAYNRRFLASVLKAKEYIARDGGPRSYSFVFTERPGTKGAMRKFDTPPRVANRWLLANSSHVIDLAFHLGGMPQKLEGLSLAGATWKPHPSLFSGSGITKRGTSFAYHANWELPGPWSVEVGTKKRKLILAPLETLREEKDGTVSEVLFEKKLDKKFKPGFYRQMESFLGGGTDLQTLADHIEAFRWFEKIEHGS